MRHRKACRDAGGVLRPIWIAILAALAVAGALVDGAVIQKRRAAERQVVEEGRKATSEHQRLMDAVAKTRTTSEVQRGMIFDSLLRGAGLDEATAQELTAAAKPVVNLRNLRPGQKLTVMRSLEGELVAITYRADRDHELWVVKKQAQPEAAALQGSPHTWEAKLNTVRSETRTVAIGGHIDGSLFEGVLEAGETAELAVRLAEIFAYDLDFYTDPQPGDTFRLVVEKREYGEGEPPAYGKIFVAEYNNAGHPYQAVLFHDGQGRPGYYSGDGKSLQKAFLRSPLKFQARVSSHFSRARFHPILKIYRPHLGTDYAAPTGTPVQAIADGRVASAGWNGGGGRAVHLVHDRGYESYYMHLSRILVGAGQRVRQGQTVGLVGMTGLATGPHLDFRLRLRGAFVNFERLKLPPAFPVPAKDMPAFIAERDKWLPLLPSAESLKMAKAAGAH